MVRIRRCPDPRVMLGPRDRRAYRAHRGPPDRKDRLDLKDRLVRIARRRARPARKERRVLLVRLAHRGPLASRAILAHRAQLVQMVRKGRRVTLGHRARLGRQDRRDRRDRPAKMAPGSTSSARYRTRAHCPPDWARPMPAAKAFRARSAPLVRKATREILVRPAHKDPRATLVQLA